MKIDVNKCIGCGECIKMCAFEAIEIKEGKAYINQDKCRNCGLCKRACIKRAIIKDN